MLPVSAFPPGPPGASLSPFGKPHTVNLACWPNGYILPKGAWVVHTGSNQVVMFVTDWRKNLYLHQGERQLGTGFLPGSPGPPGPTPPTHDQCLEAWRAQQRTTGWNGGPIRPTPGFTPPNWGGWMYVNAPSRTLVGYNSGGLVVADGQSVVITGGGCATVIEAYSV